MITRRFFNHSRCGTQISANVRYEFENSSNCSVT